MGDITANFDRSEFACKCGCGFDLIDMNLVVDLQRIRNRLGRPIIVTSGCRCEKHNAEVGGSYLSDHTKGVAVDIAVANSKERFEILEANFRGVFPVFEIIEIGPSWLHFSVNQTKPKRVAFLSTQA
jgi:hypothetical protein